MLYSVSLKVDSVRMRLRENNQLLKRCNPVAAIDFSLLMINWHCIHTY